jgi:hypothetical protein
MPPPASAYRRIRRWPWLLLSVLLVLGSCAIGVPLVAVYTIASRVDEGAECPVCAAYEWEHDLGVLFRDQDGQLRVEKVTAPARRQALLKQRADYIAAMQADTANEGPGNSDFASVGDDKPTLTGDRATIVRNVGIRWYHRDNNGQPHIGGAIEATPWTYDIRHDNQGWRIWSVSMPAWTR